MYFSLPCTAVQSFLQAASICAGTDLCNNTDSTNLSCFSFGSSDEGEAATSAKATALQQSVARANRDAGRFGAKGTPDRDSSLV